MTGHIIVYQLRPSAVDEQGLVPALRQHITALESQHDLAVELVLKGERPLHRKQAQELYRIAQEALNNVVKNAKTDQAVISLTFEDKRVVLQIEDRGKGFDPYYVIPGKVSAGLANMRERTEMLGGTFKVESRPGEGTRIRVEVPLTRAGKSD